MRRQTVFQKEIGMPHGFARPSVGQGSSLESEWLQADVTPLG